MSRVFHKAWWWILVGTVVSAPVLIATGVLY
jgi:hypothetical protein